MAENGRTKSRLAEEWLHGCSGCEMALLNTGQGLLDLLQEIDIVHMPMLMDNKYGNVTGKNKKIIIPGADIGIVTGGVANDEQLNVLLSMRSQCTTLIALGTCATHGGIPALANEWSATEWLSTVFSTASTDESTVPEENLPVLLDRVYAVDEKTNVDILIPGCPPRPQVIQHVLMTLLKGKKPQLPTRSVCDTCPALRQGKGAIHNIHRFMDNSTYDPTEPPAEMQCLLEQGLLCMGPVTAAGCSQDGAPQCITARVPCRGCFGPVRHKGNQLLDMMNALASNGIDFTSVIDRRSLLRFSGAHGRIRKKKKSDF
jgi:F420-non-reducing hydrogenase small subunit